MKFSSLLLLVTSTLVLSPLACASDGLIGGTCATGYEFCDGACVSVSDDEMNCGVCGEACVSDLACIEAVCGGPTGDVTVGDLLGMGGLGAGGSGGENSLNGSGGTGVGGDGQGASGSGGDGSGGANTGGAGASTGNGGGPTGVCLAPYATPEFCGDCDTTCTGSTPRCAPDGMNSYECVPSCMTDPFTTDCSGQCVDTDTDANNCGGCGTLCDSGICGGGSCVGKTSGHMIAMCMSFEVPSPSQTGLLGNSIFLAGRNPVRILAYTGDTSSAAKAGTNFALASAGIAKGRAYDFIEAKTSASVLTRLDRSNFDVFLVYDQENSSNGELATLGTNWTSAIDDFTAVGGVVVVLTGGGGTGEMHEFISAISLVNATGTSDHTGQDYSVEAPGDAVGINIVSPFRGVQTSCTFGIAGGPPDLTRVMVTADKDDASRPGVVHRIIVP